MINIFIFGSCVSRDAIEFFPTNSVILKQYFARSSFASLTSKKNINKKIVSNIPSKFQARVVQADMEKTFWNVLEREIFDILLVDLIDERFNLNVFDDGSIHTISADYARAAKGIDLSAVKINRYSDRKFALWKKGFDQLLSYLNKTGQSHKLRVNKVYWSKVCDEQKVIPHYSSDFIDESNAFLEKMYLYIESKLGCSCFINYEENVFIAKSDHKWGIEPFHYTDTLYKKTVDVIMNGNNSDKDNFHFTSRCCSVLDKTLKSILGNKSFAERGEKYFCQGELWLGNFSAVTASSITHWQLDPFNNRTWQWFLNWFCFISDFIAYDAKLTNDEVLNTTLNFIEDWAANYLDTNLDHKFEFVWHDHGTALRAEQVLIFIYYVSKYRQDWYKNNLNRIGKLKNFLYKHACLLLENEFYSEHTNHGLEQSRVLLLLSNLTENFPSSFEWRKVAVERINSELSFSFTEEGVHVENSPAYHYFVLKIFLGIISGYDSDLGNLSFNFKSIAAKALDYLTHIIQPNGRLPAIGDSDEFRVADIFHEYFSGTKEYENFLYVISDGAKGVKPKEIVKVYPVSGYVIVRDKWGEPGKLKYDSQFIFKAGSLSQYHRHQDDGSFVLYANETSIFVDSGLYNHNRTDPIRKYMRSRLAHNVIRVYSASPPDSWDEIKSSWSFNVNTTTDGKVSLSYYSAIYKGYLINRKLEIDLVQKLIHGHDSIIQQVAGGFSGDVLFHIDPSLVPRSDNEHTFNLVNKVGKNICQVRYMAENLPVVEFGSKNSKIFSVMSKLKNESEQNYVLRVPVSSLTPTLCWDISF